ncbi:MAG: serine/threonine protein kinase [Planctomycetes bacterium]|nr:serine/threonine protein kinase [Planctomycetota bacterium]
MKLCAGDLLGPFRLVSKLGEGGFAEVWKAERPEEAGVFEALKVATDPELARQLRTEEKLRRRLVHPNIVRLLGENLESTPPFLRMEFVEGKSLELLLAERGPLPVGEALGLAEGIARALSYAHGQQVVHADVKPGNVLIGKDGIAKLTDFGLGQVTRDLARSIVHSMTAMSDERSRAIAGTLDYMSPEQREGKELDGRADLYALGKVLYRMLTGRLPTGLRLPSEALPGVPPQVDGLVARLLEARDDRTPSAERFLEELAAVRAALARPSRSTQPSTRTLALLLVGGLGALVVAAPWERGALGVASAPRLVWLVAGAAMLALVLRTLRPLPSDGGPRRPQR